MKILITGAAGFIGSHTAEALQAAGHEVTGIDNFSAYYDVSIKKDTAAILQAKGINILEADLAGDNWQQSIPANFDYIFHFAAQPGISSDVSFNDYLKNNFIATQNLLQFAEANHALKLFVNISTSSVYGKDATGSEETMPQPVSYYGVTKLAAEQLALTYARMGKLKACSLRLFSVYGPRERPDKLYTKLIDAIVNQHEFPLFTGSEKHVRSFTYVGDIVKGITSVIGAEDACNGQIINLGTEQEHTTQYGIDAAEELLGKKAALKITPARFGDQLRTKANIDKARQLLNYDPSTSLKDGLAAQIKWFLKEEDQA